jgi:predicted deacetylase
MSLEKSITRLTGHKYPYVGSLNIVDTDKKYIKELERQMEGYLDYWRMTTHEIKEVIWPEIIKLRRENREMRVELAMLKKAIQKAQRMTNQRLE